MAGLEVLIPSLGIMLNSNITNDYPWIRPYLEILGNSNQIQLVIWYDVPSVRIFNKSNIFGFLKLETE